MYIVKLDGDIAVVESDGVIITDEQSALDFIVSVGYEYQVSKIILHKFAITEDLFRLSTGIAGEVAQKFVNYSYRLAIVGDFSGYTSKPLQDYMRECNNGRALYFAAEMDDAISWLKG